MHDTTADTIHSIAPAREMTASDANRATADSKRFLSDPAWLVLGDPEHPEHDALGLRNPKGIPVPELAVIGGGQVYGEGLSATQNWPAQLGRRMGGGVINAGMSGWGSVQYALAAEKLRALSPRRIIVCLTPGSDLAKAFTGARVSVSPWRARFSRPSGPICRSPTTLSCSLPGGPWSVCRPRTRPWRRRTCWPCWPSAANPT